MELSSKMTAKIIIAVVLVFIGFMRWLHESSDTKKPEMELYGICFTLMILVATYQFYTDGSNDLLIIMLFITAAATLIIIFGNFGWLVFAMIMVHYSVKFLLWLIYNSLLWLIDLRDWLQFWIDL